MSQNEQYLIHRITHRTTGEVTKIVIAPTGEPQPTAPTGHVVVTMKLEAFFACPVEVRVRRAIRIQVEREGEQPPLEDEFFQRVK